MDIAIGDKVTVVPSVTIGSGDVVSDYVLAVEVNVSYEEEEEKETKKIEKPKPTNP